MKKKILKRLFIVLGLSLILAGLAFLPVALVPEFTDPGYRVEVITSSILITLWGFSLIPAFVAEYDYLKNKSFEFGVWYGRVVGLVLPLLIAPALAVVYFVGETEKLIRKE